MNNEKYKVTFTTKDKYHPTTRSIEVDCTDPYAAVLIVANKFDSVKVQGNMYVPSEHKITIDKVEKVEPEEVEEVSA